MCSCILKTFTRSLTFGFYDGASYPVFKIGVVLLLTWLSTTIIGYVLPISLQSRVSSQNFISSLTLFSMKVLFIL